MSLYESDWKPDADPETLKAIREANAGDDIDRSTGLSLSTFGAIMFAIGVLFVAMTIGHFIHSLYMARICTEPSSAEVVNVIYEPARDEDDSDDWTPVIRYTADRGLEYVKTADIKTHDPEQYKVGDEIEIRYNPDDPGQYIIGDGTVDPLPYIVFGTVSLVALVLPYSVVKWRGRRREREASRDGGSQASQTDWQS